MTAIEKIRKAIREQRYRISSHANEEMSDDNLEALDVEQALLTGVIAHKFTRDPRGTRYEVIGTIGDQRQVGVVCRFLQDQTLLIITAYEIFY
ncbi:MAG: DUF4258 domain-containing protein [candidate division KSB1 bacterium]|mgnify:CR=1 FL=1